MDSITLQNYRCFGSEEQTARLAPLTLLVGPNSTGKTSFLALIRALWDVAFREVVPNFREEPFDLGSFDDIVHRSTTRGERADGFKCEFTYIGGDRIPRSDVKFNSTFSQRTGSPFPSTRTIAAGGNELTIESADEGADIVQFRASDGPIEKPIPWRRLDPLSIIPFRSFLSMNISWGNAEDGEWMSQLDGKMMEAVVVRLLQAGGRIQRPLAGAPTRSRPRRTYDPGILVHDPEGDYIPSYLASLSRRNDASWKALKGDLEGFGRTSGLFDEIAVRSFGISDGDPFQIQIRKYGRRRKGPWRNLIDVGYGVSQALPMLTELLRQEAPTMFLLQQPEVHLHPQAQAALGTLLCRVAAEGRQLVVETHSDYIIDRVRMDVRDGTTGLKSEDVSILYFEPGDLDVKIHSIRIDSSGNVLDAPLSYGNFFMDEVSRSIGLRKG